MSHNLHSYKKFYCLRVHFLLNHTIFLLKKNWFEVHPPLKNFLFLLLTFTLFCMHIHFKGQCSPVVLVFSVAYFCFLNCLHRPREFYMWNLYFLNIFCSCFDGICKCEFFKGRRTLNQLFTKGNDIIQR